MIDGRGNGSNVTVIDTTCSCKLNYNNLKQCTICPDVLILVSSRLTFEEFTKRQCSTHQALVLSRIKFRKSINDSDYDRLDFVELFLSMVSRFNMQLSYLSLYTHFHVLVRGGCC